MIRWLAWFLLGSFVGWLWEAVFFGNKAPTPFLGIYGYGTVMLVLLREALPTAPRSLLALAAGFLLMVFECVAGHFVADFRPHSVWDYSSMRGSLCSGYAAVPVALVWTVAAYFAFLLVDFTHQFRLQAA